MHGPRRQGSHTHVLEHRYNIVVARLVKIPPSYLKCTERYIRMIASQKMQSSIFGKSLFAPQTVRGVVSVPPTRQRNIIVEAKKGLNFKPPGKVAKVRFIIDSKDAHQRSMACYSVGRILLCSAMLQHSDTWGCTLCAVACMILNLTWLLCATI